MWKVHMAALYAICSQELVQMAESQPCHILNVIHSLFSQDCFESSKPQVP